MKIADSFFVNHGDTTKVQLKYPFSGTIIMQTPRNEYRLNKDGKVERNDGVGWVIPITEDPDYHKNLIILADLNKTSQPVNVFKYYWNKIFKNEQGGTMNYAQYLLTGGDLAQPEIEERLGEQQVNELVLAVINGDEAAALTLVENAIKDPENAYISETLASAVEAAQNGDETAQKFMAVIGPMLEQIRQAQSLKCGGRVRAKVKKACGGKKLEKGAKVPVEKKGGCPCQYRRVGGRIQLVDCNGIPVAKNGAVMKFADPAGSLPTVTFGKNKNGVNTYTIGDRTYVGYSGTFSDNKGTAPVDQMNLLRDALKWANETNGSAYKQMAGNVYSKFGTDRLYGKVSKDGKTKYYSNLGASDAQWNSDTNLWEREGYTYTPYKMQNGLDSFKWVQNEPTELPEIEVVAPKLNKTAGQLMFERGLASGTLSDYSLKGRQNWVNSAENQAYLEANGWDAAKRAAYKGSAADNRELLKLILGRAAWKPEIIQPQMSAGEKFVSEGYASGRSWQDAELQNMDSDQAIHLKTPDYNRWMSLNFNQTKAKPYVAPASPVLNPNAVRKDIYNITTARAPFAQINPIVAARKDGGKLNYADYLK